MCNKHASGATDDAVCATLSLGECELARMMRTRFSDFEDNLIVATALGV